MNKILFLTKNISAMINRKLKRKKNVVGGRKKEIYSKIISSLTDERFSEPGISEYALIVESSKIAGSATISAGAYIGANVRIGEHTRIYPNATILDDTFIGDNVIVGSGTVIGGEGFGYYAENKTNNLKRVPQIGKVVIEDYVEIGSNVSINRGSIKDTFIGKRTKINCNVHIAHNISIGKSCIIMAGVSINGSTEIGNNVVINPLAAISKHLKIGDNVEIGMNSTVIRDVKPNTRVLGSPAIEK